MVTESVQREGRRQGPEAAFREAPQQGVGFEIKRCALSVCITPHLRKPGNVVAGVDSVGNGVEGVVLCETDNGVGGVM